MVSERNRRSKQSAWLALAACAAAMLGLYALLAWRIPLIASLANPRSSWINIVGGWPQTGLFIVAIFSLTLLYRLAIRLVNSSRALQAEDKHPGRNSRRINATIVAAWLAFCLVIMTMPASGESHDIFDYIFRGRMMVEYGANPLSEIPKDYSQAPFYRYLSWHSHVDTYGPLWEMTSAGTARVVRAAAVWLGVWQDPLGDCPASPAACHTLIAYLTGYRLLAVGLMGGCALLIASMLNHRQSGLAAAGLVAWLWNPLGLFVAALGAHNDLLMVFFFLSALLLMQRRRPFFALLALLLAAHVKLTAVIWAPLFAVWVWRTWGWRRALTVGFGALAAGLLVSWLLYLPFAGWATLPGMLHERSLYLANSAWNVLYIILYKQIGWSKEIVLRWTVDLPTWLFAASAVLLPLWQLIIHPNGRKDPDLPTEAEKPDDDRLWSAALAVSLLFLFLGAYWFQHWYLIWVIAPAVLLPRSVFTRQILPWLSYGGLLANFAGSWVLFYFPEKDNRPWVEALIVLLIWSPALIAGLVAWIRRQKHQQIFLI